MKKALAVKASTYKFLKGLMGVCFAAAAFLVLCPSSSRGEVPVRFTYQGNLRQNGFLVNGSRSMVFRIYDSSTSASELWTSPAYAVSLSTGVFRVVLEPAITDWESGALWLELEIEGDRLSPREELTSAPYSINALMHSGKRYDTAASAPAPRALGDLWLDSVTNTLKFWNGSVWMLTSGSGVPGSHAFTHGPYGSDPIVALGTHSVAGYVTVSSSVTAGWLAGDGAGVYNLDASKISSGLVSGDRIGEVIVSGHIVDGSIQGQDLANATITRAKLNRSGCASGDMLQWDGVEWACASGATGGLETDPLSIHNQETLQAGATFHVSSGTVNNLNVGELAVTGTQTSGEYIAVFNSGPRVAAWLRNK